MEVIYTANYISSNVSKITPGGGYQSSPSAGALALM